MMKVAALAFALLLIGALAFADTMEAGTHYVDRCVKVTNIDDYPGIYFVAAVSYPGGDINNLYAIKQGECLTKGYKFNGFAVYWAPMGYIESVGNASKADVASGSMHLITKQIEPFGGYVPDSNPKTNETIDYVVVKTADGYTLQLASEKMPSLPPNNTTPHTPTPQNPAPTPLEPLQAFWCWLMGIFGQKC